MNTVDHIAGQTYHGRRGKVKNAFRYSIDYVLLDTEALVDTPRLFARNAGALMSLHDGDHGGVPSKGQGAAWARDVLAAHGICSPSSIKLLAQPRILGHVFNPVSFWLCYDDMDLTSVIAEVSNTFGDRHSYLCRNEDGHPITKADTIQADKVFHVSPFQPIEGGYTFRFDITEEQVGVWIDYSRGGGGMIATFHGKRHPLTNRSIVRATLRRPFGSRRVLALIHWQAVKLWLKGATFRSRPKPPVDEVSQ